MYFSRSNLTQIYREEVMNYLSVESILSRVLFSLRDFSSFIFISSHEAGVDAILDK